MATREEVDKVIELYDRHFNNEMEISDYVKTLNLTTTDLKEIMTFTLNHPHAIRSKELLNDTELVKKITGCIGEGDFHG